MEIANWFRIWLETPDAFFDWLDVRKQSPDFRIEIPASGDAGMSLPPGAPPGALELPPFSLDVEALDLGPGVKAVGLELVETENREPFVARRQRRFGRRSSLPWRMKNITSWIFSATSIALRSFARRGRSSIAKQACAAWFCRSRGRVNCSSFSSASKAKPLEFAREPLRKLPMPRWKATFPSAASTPTKPPMSATLFCAVCEPEDGWVTLLSATLWASEVIRRVRPAVLPFDIYIARPQ